jgi:Fe-S oxidoreductase
VTDVLAIGKALQIDSSKSKPKDKIYLLREAYVNYFYSNELQNAYELLKKLGLNVELTKVFENGKALHAKGFLNRFRKVVAKNLDYLNSLQGQLISIDPSIALSYRDEYCRFNDQKIDVLYLPEFLGQLEGRLDFKKYVSAEKKYHLILHCSEQTNITKITEIWSAIFKKIGIDLNIIKVGCCGMSGSFGTEVENFADSKIIFESNWQHIIAKLAQDQANVIMVSGSSCQMQVDRFLKDVKIHNPFVVLNEFDLIRIMS